MKEEEQVSCLLIQRWVRAALIRRRLVRMRAAVVVIQKYKRMIDCMKSRGAYRAFVVTTARIRSISCTAREILCTRARKAL